MMAAKSSRTGQLWFKAALVFGCLVGLLLLAQSVAGYFYVSRRLVRDQLQREADRQAIRLERALRALPTPDTSAIATALNEHLEEQQQRVAWLRIIDGTGRVIAQAGSPVGSPPSADRIRRSFEDRRDIRRLAEVGGERVFVAVVPVRFGAPPRGEAQRGRGPRLLEVALREEIASGTFGRLQLNLIVSSVAALMLVASMLLLARWLRSYVRAQQLEQQFAVARRVQHELLPDTVATFPDMECAGTCIPAWQVGGDFYDVFAARGGRVAMLVGDVSGKGLGAALVMSLLHGAIRCSEWVGGTLQKSATGRLNSVLCDSTAQEMFATLFWAWFEAPFLHYVNAGHLPPLLLRKSGVVERLTEGGPVLGVVPDAEYRQGVVRLDEGDLLVLYSDGVLEAADATDEEFGEQRLQRIVTGSAEAPCSEICEEIVRNVRAFAGGQSLEDDLTLLLVRVRAKERRIAWEEAEEAEAAGVRG